jgi:hypothetical protein
MRGILQGLQGDSRTDNTPRTKQERLRERMNRNGRRRGEERKKRKTNGASWSKRRQTYSNGFCILSVFCCRRPFSFFSSSFSPFFLLCSLSRVIVVIFLSSPAISAFYSKRRKARASSFLVSSSARLLIILVCRVCQLISHYFCTPATRKAFIRASI